MNLSIDPNAPEDVVQFTKHLEENLDVDDSDVTIQTVKKEDSAPLPGEEIPIRNEAEYANWGVRIHVSPDSQTVSTSVDMLAGSFYEDFLINTSYSSGEDTIFVFENEA